MKNFKQIMVSGLLMLLLTISARTMAQQNEPFAEVGKAFGDFKLTDVQHYSRKQINDKEFIGKWLVLDFWNRYCSTCLEKMPHLDTLREAFDGKISLFLVGYTGSRYNFNRKSDDKSIRVLYERYSREEKLGLAIAYDSLLFHRLDIGACPFIVVIDPEGIVRAVTTSINREQLQELMSGKQTAFDPAYRREEFKAKRKQNKTE